MPSAESDLSNPFDALVPGECWGCALQMDAPIGTKHAAWCDTLKESELSPVCGIADCTGEHWPQDHNACVDSSDHLRTHDGWDLVAELREENAELWKQIRLAKQQRDRAIYKTHQLGAKGWHPDQEGPYRNE